MADEVEGTVVEERMITVELPFMDKNYTGWFPKITERCVVMLNAIKTGVDLNEDDIEIMRSFHKVWFEGWHVWTRQVPALPSKKSVQKELFSDTLAEQPTQSSDGTVVEPLVAKQKSKKK